MVSVSNGQVSVSDDEVSVSDDEAETPSLIVTLVGNMEFAKVSKIKESFFVDCYNIPVWNKMMPDP